MVFVKEELVVTNTFEESFKNNPFCLEWLLIEAAKAIETWGLSIMPVRVMGDKADEEYKLHRKSGKALQLLVL